MHPQSFLRRGCSAASAAGKRKRAVVLSSAIAHDVMQYEHYLYYYDYYFIIIIYHFSVEREGLYERGASGYTGWTSAEKGARRARAGGVMGGYGPSTCRSGGTYELTLISIFGVGDVFLAPPNSCFRAIICCSCVVVLCCCSGTSVLH